MSKDTKKQTYERQKSLTGFFFFFPRKKKKKKKPCSLHMPYAHPDTQIGKLAIRSTFRTH
jgi:hypothetical protein